MVMRNHVTQCNSVTRWYVFNSFSQQWSSTAQMKRRYQPLDTQTKRFIGFSLFMGFADSKKDSEYLQPRPLKSDLNMKQNWLLEGQ